MKKQYRDFESAREFARTINLKSQAEWFEYSQSGNKPDDIPTSPAKTYKNKGWKGFGDWLGTGTVATFNIQYRPFKDAREFVQKLGLKNTRGWKEYCKSSNKPDDIPSTPRGTYKKDFKGFGDWLGTGTVAPKDRVFLSFKDAREFVRRLGLKGQNEWLEYCASGNRPDDIPSTPRGTYKNEYKGDGDWLGTGTVAPKDRVFLSFKDAREFVQKLGLKSRKELNMYYKSGNKPDDIPTAPDKTYKKDFKGYGDWLGTGRIADQNKVYRSFESAREFARGLNLKGVKEWKEYCRSGDKPDYIPTSAAKTYKKDFKGWGDFLGTGNVAHKDREFLPFKKAREFARGLNFKNTTEWYEYCKSGKKPDDIPTAPSGTYKKDFKGMGDFLGTGTISSQDKVYRSFESAREFARGLNLKGVKEWHAYCKSGNKPNNIPQKPERTYKKDWKGVGDWTGTGNVAHKDREFLPFKKAREFVRKLGLKNYKEWDEYCKSGDKPKYIPAHPWDVYKGEKKK